MTTTKSKWHNYHILCGGFVDGFSPIKLMFADQHRLRAFYCDATQNSLYEIWESVGDSLAEAMQQVDLDVETSEAYPANRRRERYEAGNRASQKVV